MEYANNHQRKPKKITACNQSDFESIGYLLLCPKISLDIVSNAMKLLRNGIYMDKPFCYMKPGHVNLFFK